jgi:hypothetical protein
MRASPKLSHSSVSAVGTFELGITLMNNWKCSNKQTGNSLFHNHFIQISDVFVSIVSVPEKLMTSTMKTLLMFEIDSAGQSTRTLYSRLIRTRPVVKGMHGLPQGFHQKR